MKNQDNTDEIEDIFKSELQEDKIVQIEKNDAAQAQIRANRDGVDKRFEVVNRLK